MALPILVIFYKWNRIICVLLIPAYFTKHNVFEVYPHCHTYQHSVPCCGRIVFHHMDTGYLCVHPSVDEHAGYFHLLATVNHAAVNMCGQGFV